MSKYVVEKGKGVPMTRDNLFVKDITDMEILEYWEDRLETLKQPYIVAYRPKDGKMVYSIFTKMRSKGSAFK